MNTLSSGDSGMILSGFTEVNSPVCVFRDGTVPVEKLALRDELPNSLT